MTITNDLWVTRQALRGTSTDDAHEPKLRADIKRDFYDDQCYARLESWSDERGWVLIRNLPTVGCLIMRHHSVEPGMGRDVEWREAMQKDMDYLLEFGRDFYKGKP